MNSNCRQKKLVEEIENYKHHKKTGRFRPHFLGYMYEKFYEKESRHKKVAD